jgi:DnaB helicase-like protein/AAA domain-containing protein
MSNSNRPPSGTEPDSDRLLPHDENAERAVLGSILIENSKLAVVQEVLVGKDFYKDANVKLFLAMGRLAERGSGVDEITLKDELQRTGELEAVGGPAYIASLADNAPYPEHVIDYSRIVREKATLRSLIATADSIQRRAYTDGHDPAALLAELEKEVEGVRMKASIAGSSGFPLRTWDLSVAAFEAVAAVDWLVEPIMAPPDVVSLVGDGGVGKSKVAASTALAVAFGKSLWGHFLVSKPGKVIYVNEERPDITLRHLHTLAPSMGIDPKEIQDRIFLIGRGSLVWRVTDAAARRAVVQFARERGDIVLIIWDSLHVLHDKEENDNSEMTQVVLGFQEICTSLGCCGLLLHHTGKSQLLDSTQSARGATAIKDTVDSQFQVRRPKEDVLDQVRLSQDKTRRSLVPPFLLHLDHTDQGDVTAVSWIGKAPSKVEEALAAVLEILSQQATPVRSKEVPQKLGGRFRNETVYAALKIVREQNLARWQGDDHDGYLYGGEPGDP